MSGLFSGVRWRDDTGWEMRCEACFLKGIGSAYWPLTHEFWEPRNMKRCRACHKELQAARKREKYQKEPAYRARKVEQNQRWRSENPIGVREHARSRWERLVADPEKLAAHTEKQRERQRLYKQRQRAKARREDAA